MKDIQKANEEIKKLVIERSNIFNSLDSRFSKRNEKYNTQKLCDATGLGILDVKAVYSPMYCHKVKKTGIL